MEESSGTGVARTGGRDPLGIPSNAIPTISRFDPKERTMAQTETLHDVFLEELKDVYDAEQQLSKALPKLAKAARSSDLRTAFEHHLRETEGHIERLERIFESLDERPKAKRCKGIAGIIEEGESVMKEDFDGSTKDAALIAGGQRAEHYEIAAYGTLAAWARLMGHGTAADLLEQTLDEEKAADETLSRIAEDGVNADAVASWSSRPSEE
jgi:ferritin-like metal-binding protein YciE